MQDLREATFEEYKTYLRTKSGLVDNPVEGSSICVMQSLDPETGNVLAQAIYVRPLLQYGVRGDVVRTFNVPAEFVG